MSGISGVGAGHHHHVSSVGQSAPTAPTADAASSDQDPLKALQGLVKQLEVSANTRAIPAHQNW